MNSRDLNPYTPGSADNAPLQFWRRTWFGFPVISFALFGTGTAFIATGFFVAKVALVDASPSPQNQKMGFVFLLMFVLSGFLQWTSALLYFRERKRAGLVFLVASPLAIVLFAVLIPVLVYLFDG